MIRRHVSTRARARGVTLIEVLVTMVITAVGLLGLAGLQVRGLSIQKDAHGRSIATQLALDIADRMRSNVGAVTDYAFTTAYPTGTVTMPVAPDCETTTCSGTQQAQFDLARWLGRVRGGALPGGWARIEQNNGAWIVTLMWAETTGLRESTNASIQALLGANCPGGTPANVECVNIRVVP